MPSVVLFMAKLNTWCDFLFLSAYTFLFIVLIKRTGTEEKRVTLFVSFALLAGGLDVVENIFMLIYMQGFDIPAFTFGLVATVKFMLVIINVVYLVSFFFYWIINSAWRRNLNKA